MFDNIKKKSFEIFDAAESPQEKYQDSRATSYRLIDPEDLESKELASMICFCLDYMQGKEWYDRKFLVDCFTYLEKGYSISKWQSSRISNTHTLILHMKEKNEKSEDTISEAGRAPI